MLAFDENGNKIETASEANGSSNRSSMDTALYGMQRLIDDPDLRMTPEQAAGVMGNFWHESDGFTTMQERNPRSGRGGYGWGQWTGPRRVAFERFASDNNLDPSDDEANFQFLKSELLSGERQAFDKLKRSGGVDQATNDFMGKLGDMSGYERPGVPALNSRLNHARNIYAAWNGEGPVSDAGTGGFRYFTEADRGTLQLSDPAPKAATPSAPTEPKTSGLDSIVQQGKTLLSDTGNALEDVGYNIAMTPAKSNPLNPSNLSNAAKAGVYGLSEGSAGLIEGAMQGTHEYLTGPIANAAGVTDPFQQSAQAYGNLRRQLKAKGESLMPKTDNPTLSGVYSGVQSVAQNAFPMVAGLVTGRLDIALSGMSAAVGGQEYGKARDLGKGFEYSVMHGGAQAGIEYITEKLPTGKLFKDIKSDSGLWKTILTQVATEIPGEQAATVLQTIEEKIALQPEKTWSQLADELPGQMYQTAIATLVAAGAQSGLGYAAQKTADRIAEGTKIQSLMKDPEFMDIMANDVDPKLKGLERGKAAKAIWAQRQAVAGLTTTSADRDTPEDTSISSTGIPGETNAQDTVVSNQGNDAQGREGIVSQAEAGRQGGEGGIQVPETDNATQGPQVNLQIQPFEGGYQIVDGNNAVISQHPDIEGAIETLDQLNADLRETETTASQETPDVQSNVSATPGGEIQTGSPSEGGTVLPQSLDGSSQLQGAGQETQPQGHNGLIDPVIQPVPNGYQVVDANSDQVLSTHPTYRDALNAIDALPAGGQVIPGTQGAANADNTQGSTGAPVAGNAAQVTGIAGEERGTGAGNADAGIRSDGGRIATDGGAPAEAPAAINPVSQPAVAPKTPDEVVSYYLADQNIGQGGALDDAARTWANRTLKPTAMRVTSTWKPTRQFWKSKSDEARQGYNRALKILVDSGYAQIAWDIEGNPHYAKAGSPVPDGLYTEGNHPLENGAGNDIAPAMDVVPEAPTQASLIEKLKAPGVIDRISDLVSQAGWAQKGGHLYRDANGKPNRTTWLPKQDWWMERPDKTTQKDFEETLRRLQAGESLSPKHEKIADFLYDLQTISLPAEDVQNTGYDELDPALADEVDELIERAMRELGDETTSAIIQEASQNAVGRSPTVYLLGIKYGIQEVFNQRQSGASGTTDEIVAGRPGQGNEGGRQNTEESGRQDTQGADLFPAATVEDRAKADQEALAEAQREQQRKSNATQAPPADDGIFALDNRQDEIQFSLKRDEQLQRIEDAINEYNIAVDRYNAINEEGTEDGGKVSRSRAKRATTLPSHGFVQRRVADAIAKVFGHQVIYVESEDGTRFDVDGSIVSTRPDYILIDANSRETLSRVVAHELTHGLRRNAPHIYAAMVKSLREVYSPTGVSTHIGERGYDQELPKAGDDLTRLSQENMNEEEWVADFVSDILHKPMAMLRVAVAMNRQKQGLGNRFLRKVSSFIDSLSSRLDRGGFNAEAVIAKKDLQRARNAVTEALARYAEMRQTGVEPEFDGPEILDSKRRNAAPAPELAKPAEADLKKSLNDMRISPRYPTAVNSAEDPNSSVRLQPDYESAKRDPAALEHNVNLMTEYPNFKGMRGKPETRVENMIEEMKGNLIWLYNHWKPEFRDRSKLWYVGGNRIAHRWAERFGIDPQQVAAVIAATSPQKDWFQNVSLAERILEAMINQSDHVWDSKMSDLVRSRDWGKKFSKELKYVPADRLEYFEGKSLKDLVNPGDKKATLDMAVWIRAWDEANNLQAARVITPEGAFSASLDVGKTGKPVALRWQSFATIGKSVEILGAKTPEEISKLIGANHKVRSFYNNLISPFDDLDVTIDTHAVAAALLRPLGSSDTEVAHNFGSSIAPVKDKVGNIIKPGVPGTKNSSIFGLYGTYAIYAEAYRRAAREVGVLPREMQSITWEAVRGLFRPEQKNDKIKTQADAIWREARKDKSGERNAREEIARLVEGIQDPPWVRHSPGSHEAGRDSSYQGELSGNSVPNAGGRAGSVDAGTGNGSANRAARDRGADVPASNRREEAAGRTDLESSSRQKANKLPFSDSLVTLHNLTEENLAHADALGGMPVPSIGISKVDSPFSGFGNITLIGSKDLIDPEKGVPVFDRDAWTSRFPEMNYKKVKAAKADAFYERMKSARDLSDDGRSFVSELWDRVRNDSKPSPDRVAELFTRYDAPRLFYAKEVLGRPIKVPTRPYNPTFFASADPAVRSFFLKNQAAVWNGDTAVQEELAKLVGEAIDRKAEEKGGNVEVRKALLREGMFAPNGTLQGRYYQSLERDASQIGTRVEDGVQLRERVRKVVPDNDPAYRKWISEQVGALFEPPTVTLRGKQVAPTLDNLVGAMTIGATQGAEKSMTFGAGKTAAILGKRFKSIAEIQAARDQVVDETREQESKRTADQILIDYRDHVVQFFTRKDYRGNIDTWAGMDAAMEALAKAGKLADTDGNIRLALQKTGFKGVDAKAIDMARQSINAMRNVATNYFEAKPQRAVMLNEFRGAVVPKSASPESMAILEKHGLQIETYGNGEGARDKAIAKLAKRLDKPTGDILFSKRRNPNPTFYSQLARGFESSKMNVMPGSQWKAWLLSNKAKMGIKDDEIAWTGIEDFLTLNAKEKLTKADIASYLADNGVQVQDVMKGGDIDKRKAAWSDLIAILKNEDNLGYDRASEAAADLVSGGLGIDQIDVDDDVRKKIRDSVEKYRADGIPTKYDKYTIPGGTNYRELLIKLPGKRNDLLSKKRSMEIRGALLQGNPNYEKDRAEYDAIVEELMAVKEYKSGHWDEKNVLAHIRFDERTDADGNKVMFIQELQSDWGQDGKKKGFGDNERLKEARKRHQEARSELADEIRKLDPEADIDEAITMTRRHFNGSALIPQMTDEIEQRLRPLVRTEMNTEEALRREESAGPGIPKAPFVTDTKSWLSLGLKRAIRYAAENGFDKIAFSNGQQNADLYDLSKQVDTVVYEPDGRLFAIDGSRTVFSEENVSPEKIEDYIGKELAQKLLDTPANSTGNRQLSGLDLKVGGEGMRTFYDKIVPQTANDVLKKLGGGRVGSVEIDTRSPEDDAYYEDITETDILSQPGFDITPALQDKALDGMPLFSNRRNVLDQPSLATWTDPAGSHMDDLVYKLQNKHIDTKRIVDTIKPIEQFDPYLKEALYHGRAAKDVDDFKVNEIKPLLQAMSMRGITIDELETFLWNRHAPEANAQIARINEGFPDGGSGISTQDALDYMANLPAGKRTDLDALAAQIDAITAGTRRLLVESGLETQETIDAWESTYRDYVPLNRESADISARGMGSGQGFSTKGPASKRRTGSSKNVSDILANVMLQRERAITRAEKNKVGLALYGLAIQNPNPGFWYPVNPDAVRKPASVAQELIEQGMLDTDIAGLIKEPTVAQVNKQTGMVEHRINPALRNRDNVLAVRINGKDRFLFFSTENERAVRMAEALKNLDSPEMHGLMNAFRMVTRYVSSINTQYNPIFGVKNLIRDVGAGLLNLSTTPIAGKQDEVAKYTGPALLGIWKDLRADRAGKPRSDSDWSRLWEEFQTIGGKTGYRDMYRDSGDRMKALEKELKAIQSGKVSRLTRGLFDWLSDYNETLENSVRLAAYKVGIDSGISKERAAVMAKELTVNFNRKGQVASQAGSLYAFFNAAVQGTARLTETLKGPAGKKIVAGGLAWGVIQSLILAAAGYDDDEPPEFVRERNIIIPMPGGKYVTLPMPLGFHVIPNTGRIMMDMALYRGDTGKRVANLLGSYFEAFNPIGSAGWSVQTIAPTFADPLVALAENRDSFGKQIAKEDRSSSQPTPGFSRTKDTASVLSKRLAWGINRMTGGTDYTQGVLSPTPDQLDYIFSQATGGVGREVMKIEQAASSWMSGEELPPYKYPLGVGTFVGDTKAQASESNRFYSNITRLNELEAEIKGRMADGKDVQSVINENPESAFVTLGNKAEQAVTKLRSRKRKLIAQGAAKNEIKAIDTQITAQMKALNDQIKPTRITRLNEQLRSITR